MGPDRRPWCWHPRGELVVQVAEEGRKLVPSRHCHIVPIYGGQRIQRQFSELRTGCHVAVGTPGRLLDHLSRGTLNLHKVRYVVLDEADRMLDIGFRPDIEKILALLSRSAANAADVGNRTASAVAPGPPLHGRPGLPQPVAGTGDGRVDPPVVLHCGRGVANSICWSGWSSPQASAPMHHLLRAQAVGREAVQAARRTPSKYAAAMHGDLPQPVRDRIMKDFRQGKIICLVATDVVGRGIDVTNISHIINYDLPEDPENYVHRIGRTGRMGADGRAIAFVTPEQGERLTGIECFINLEIPEDNIEGFQAYIPREVKPQESPQAPTDGAGLWAAGQALQQSSLSFCARRPFFFVRRGGLQFSVDPLARQGPFCP